MGIGLLAFYRTKIKPEWKLTFLAAFLMGLLVHTYLFTNSLLNHDALFNYYSDQNIVGSGRWLLSIACGFSSYFNLPWLIGILSLVFIALTAVVIVDIFQVKNPILVLLISGILVSFPAITGTFYFEFTADGYMIAMLLAALSVRLFPMGKARFSAGAASALCICLSCGIYQAYVSFALVLAIGYFLAELLEGNRTDRQCLTWVLGNVLIYAASMAAYYIIWKLCLHFQHFAPTTYLGMDRLGRMDLPAIGSAISDAISNFVLFFLEWNILDHGFTAWNGINILFLIFAAITLVTALAKSGLFRRKLQLGLGILAAAVIPFAVFLWLFASPEVEYAIQMEQSLCVLYILIAVLADRWLSAKASSAVGLLLAVFVFSNSVTANLFYYHMHRCNQQSYATAIELATRIHQLDNGKISRIAIGGRMEGWEKSDVMDPAVLAALGPLKSVDKSLLKSQTLVCLFLDNELDFELGYYVRDEFVPFPEQEKSEFDPVPDNWHFRFPVVSAQELYEIENTDQYRRMPCWPADGSLAVMDDVIVVKLPWRNYY